MILLIEDNADDEALTLRALKKNNILNTVVVLRDGAQALEYVDQMKTAPINSVPSLILLDLNLPKVNGLEVLKKVRSTESTRLLPVVILTSSKEEVDLINSYDLGANSYIQKPVEFTQFTEAVKQLGVYWLLINEPAPVKRPDVCGGYLFKSDQNK